MATASDVWQTLTTGAETLVGSLTSIKSVQEVPDFLLYALVEYQDPAVKCVALAFIMASLAFILGFLTDNYSWVDKQWSLVPVAYAAIIASHTPMALGADLHPRLALATAIIVVWGVRLTYNFARKGGYKFSGEDYRWPVIKNKVNPVIWQIFNFVFIAFIQHALLVGIVAPIYVAWYASYTASGRDAAPLNAIDAAAAVCTLGFLLMETVADQQQWKFQTAKHAAIDAKKELTADQAKGFLDKGLWRFSRHPNFFAEQAFWWSMCLFATAATGRWVGWWLVPVVGLSGIFQGSTPLTEKISASKYPAYAAYQASTSRLVPWFSSAAAVAESPAAEAEKTPRTRRRSSSATGQSASASVKSKKKEEAAAAAAEKAAAAEPVEVEEESKPSRSRATARRASTRRAPSDEKPVSGSRSRSASGGRKPRRPAKAASAKADSEEETAPVVTEEPKKKVGRPRSAGASAASKAKAAADEEPPVPTRRTTRATRRA